MVCVNRLFFDYWFLITNLCLFYINPQAILIVWRSMRKLTWTPGRRPGGLRHEDVSFRIISYIKIFRMQARDNWTAHIRFYEELNDYLPENYQKKSFEIPLSGNSFLKEIIESLGIPISEVDLILVNGQSVNLEYRINPGDMVSVYPVFESMDISSVSRIREKQLRETRFVLDDHLGKLARYLRMLGYSSYYDNKFTDEEIITLAERERCIILTRDKELLKHKSITHGYFVRSNKAVEQLIEVLSRLDLKRSIRPFRICLKCNEKIIPVSKDEIQNRLDVNTKIFYNEFYSCSGCGRIYWKGSHYERMVRFIKALGLDV